MEHLWSFPRAQDVGDPGEEYQPHKGRRHTGGPCHQRQRQSLCGRDKAGNNIIQIQLYSEEYKLFYVSFFFLYMVGLSLSPSHRAVSTY